MMFDSSDSDFEDETIERPPNMPRIYREREDFEQTLDDYNFTRRFRLNKEAFRSLLARIEQELDPPTKR